MTGGQPSADGREAVQAARETPAFKQGAAIAVATGLYGTSFGALATAAGFDVWQAVALSFLLLSGGSQFAFIGVIAGGGSGASAFGASTLLGLRNAVYGMQMNALTMPRGPLRFLAAHVTIDESAATATAQPTLRERRIGFWAAGAGVWILWTAFTAVGAVAGASLGNPASWGLDGAACAAFLGLLWPRLKQRDAAACAVVVALGTALAVPMVPPGIPIIIAAVVAAGFGFAATRSAGQAAVR